MIIRKTFVIFILFFSINLYSATSQQKKFKNIIYTYLLEHQYDLARDACKEYIAVFPDDCEGYKLYGMIYEKEQRIDDAVKYYAEAGKNSGCKCLLYYAGKLSFINGAYRKSIFYLSSFLDKNNSIQCKLHIEKLNRFEIYRMLGESYFFIEDNYSAKEFLLKCLQYDIFNPEIYDFIANSYRNLKMLNYTRAYTEIRNLVIKKNYRNKDDFLFRVGLIFLKSNLFKDAIENFRKISATYEKSYVFNFDLGLAYLLNKQYDYAVTYLNNAIQLYKSEFSLKKMVLNLLKLNRHIAKYYLVLTITHILNNEIKTAKQTHEIIKDYSPGIYKEYYFEKLLNRHCKIYKELSDMWEYEK